jgi:hypothetical protein
MGKIHPLIMCTFRHLPIGSDLIFSNTILENILVYFHMREFSPFTCTLCCIMYVCPAYVGFSHLLLNRKKDYI